MSGPDGLTPWAWGDPHDGSTDEDPLLAYDSETAPVTTAEVGRLRALLERTWYPFLGRFPRPTRVQVDAIPLILAGSSLLLASATATGKTEAYAAPLAERALREGWQAPGILVVSPTRALANDLCRRLEIPFRSAGLVVQRKTGDHPSFDDDKPAHVVITTPESLDSLLARRPEALKTVRAVVLDELHVLDGTARGDQLAILMTRLERLVQGVAAAAAVRGRAMPVPLQRVAATATVERMEEVALRYLGRRAQVCRVGGRRDIEAVFVEGSDALAVRGFLAQHCGRSDSRGSRAPSLQKQGEVRFRKVLLFANSRAEAENLAAACTGYPPFGADVFVHHGSLAQAERERVEKRFLEAPSALCVATMTLELGIDIGDIDLVGLLGPPHDVPSLLQRVGRGNRRSWDLTHVVCFHDTAGQRVRFEHLLDCARRGYMAQPRRTFRPSVLVQQAFSLLFQNRNRFVDARSLSERLPSDLGEIYPPDRLELLLAHLVGEQYLIELPGRRYGAAQRLEAMYQRGQLHANIAGDQGDQLEVIDAVTERVVGYLPRSAAESIPSSSSRRGGRGGSAPGAGIPSEIVLGGQARQVHGVRGRQLRTTSVGVAGGAHFASTGSPSVSRELATSLARYVGIEECRLPVVHTGGKVIIGHFLGSCYGRLFLECVQRVNQGRTGVGNGFVSVFAGSSLPYLEFRETDVHSELVRHRKALSGALQDGPWSPRLPTGWWNGWLCEALDLPEFLSLHDTWMVEEDVSDELTQVLLSLMPRGARDPAPVPQARPPS